MQPDGTIVVGGNFKDEKDTRLSTLLAVNRMVPKQIVRFLAENGWGNIYPWQGAFIVEDDISVLDGYTCDLSGMGGCNKRAAL